MAVPGRQISTLLVSLLGALALLVFSPAARGEDAVDHGPAGAPYTTGELLVTYEEEASDSAIESLDEEANAQVEETLPEIYARLLEFPQVKDEPSERARGQALARIKEELERDPAVESVGYNYFYSASYTPNDPRFGEQWGLMKTGFESAWDRARGSGVRIAIVDSGAAVRHVDLRQKIALQRDLINNDGTVEDPFEHGTHVAGIAAAETGNGTGVAGGCPNCKLLIAKVLDGDGMGTATDVAQGIIWSTDHGAEVVNVSLGDSHNVRAVRDAVDYATGKGAVVVAAAGNNDTNRLEYPAAYSDVIAVAATNKNDRRAWFSNYGDWVDVAAPGVGILSTVPGGYSAWDGTSMATPHVAALASLLASQGRSAVNIKKRIFNTAVDLGPTGRDPYYGYGRIDANRATRR
jgi:thermitase